MSRNKNIKRKKGTYNISHGAYHFLNTGSVPCNHCICQVECPHFIKNAQCQLVLDYRDQLRDIISSEPHITESDSILVSLLIRELCFQAVASKWFAKCGILTYDEKANIIDAQPLVKVFYWSVNAAARMCRELGLTPEARVKLGLSEQEDLGPMVRRLALSKSNSNGDELEEEESDL